MFEADADTSLRAARELSNLTAHQGIVGSISVPTFPFLIEAIDAQPMLNVLQELIEILSYFSDHLELPDTSNWSSSEWNVARQSYNYPDDYRWMLELRKEMCEHQALFQLLTHHRDPDVVSDAELTIANLDPYCKSAD